MVLLGYDLREKNRFRKNTLGLYPNSNWVWIRCRKKSGNFQEFKEKTKLLDILAWISNIWKDEYAGLNECWDRLSVDYFIRLSLLERRVRDFQSDRSLLWFGFQTLYWRVSKLTGYAVQYEESSSHSQWKLPKSWKIDVQMRKFQDSLLKTAEFDLKYREKERFYPTRI